MDSNSDGLENEWPFFKQASLNSESLFVMLCTVGPWVTLPRAMLFLNQRWFHLVPKIFDLRYFFCIFLEQSFKSALLKEKSALFKFSWPKNISLSNADFSLNNADLKHLNQHCSRKIKKILGSTLFWLENTTTK